MVNAWFLSSIWLAVLLASFFLWSTQFSFTKSRWIFNWREEKYTPVRSWYPDTNVKIFKKFDGVRLISRLQLDCCNTSFIGGKVKETTLLFAPGIRIQILKFLRKLMVNGWFHGSNWFDVILASLAGKERKVTPVRSWYPDRNFKIFKKFYG